MFGRISSVWFNGFTLEVNKRAHWCSCRFDNAVLAAERAAKIDFNNLEVAKLLSNVKMVARARSRGFDLFNSGRYTEACTAYGEGLRYDSSNHVLYCNRAVCWAKIGLWEQSVEDCNQALKIQPNYTKALLRRAASNAKVKSVLGFCSFLVMGNCFVCLCFRVVLSNI